MAIPIQNLFRCPVGELPLSIKGPTYLKSLRKGFNFILNRGDSNWKKGGIFKISKKFKERFF